MTKKKIIIISVIVLVVVMIIGGGSYAWFNYFQVSNLNNILVAGDINLKLVEGQDTLSVSNVFPETKEEARMHEDNTLTFEVNGANTSSRAIVYNVLLNEGNIISGKTRFKDDELRFDLSEIIDNNEILLVDNANFSTLSNTNIYDNIIAGNTSTVSHTYKLRMWVDESVIVSETETGNHVYTPSEYKDLYATVKLVVKGETVEGETKTVTFDADGGVVPISSKNVVVGQDYGYLPTPTKEGYTFLGWNGKNLLNYYNLSQNAINSGIQVDNNGYISDSTSNDDSRPWNYENSNWYADLTASTYTVRFIFSTKALNTDANYYSGFMINDIGDDTILLQTNGSFYNVDEKKCSFTIDEAQRVGIQAKIYDGTCKVQIEEGNDATEYEPYFVTNDTKVTEWNTDYVLKAIWQQNS